MMALDIKGELKRVYGLAVLENEAKHNLRPEEWKQYQAIQKRYDDLRNSEERAFKQEYGVRLQVEQKRLIHQKGSKQLEFRPRWFGTDHFDKDAIKHQADRNIRQNHTSLIAHLTDKETKELDKLLECAGHREKLRERTRSDFSQATDRRSGLERRQSIKRRRD